MVSQGQIYKKSPDIVFRRVGDALLLVPIRQHVADLNALYSLNDVSAFIWELCDGENSIEVILKKIVAVYEVDEAAAREDLYSLVTSLVQENAVSLVSE